MTLHGIQAFALPCWEQLSTSTQASLLTERSHNYWISLLLAPTGSRTMVVRAAQNACSRSF
jgi:hypothetical protein